MNSFFLGFIIASLIFLISLTPQAFAVTSPEVVINEFAIEPEQTVEILNTSNEIIDISGWHIDDNGGTTFVTIPPDTFMYPHACIVIQKNFNLNKTSTDTIRLFNSTSPPTDPLSELVDFYEYSSSPGAGFSYQRNPDGASAWDTAQSSFGLLNESGKSCQNLPTETPTPDMTPTHSPTAPPSVTPTQPISPTPQSYINIYISEVMVAPPSGKYEWIELYNDNDFEVNLSGWYIDDAEQSGSLPKQFSTTIAAKKYVVIELSSAIFNNSGDSVRLLDFEENIKSVFSYDHSEKGKSWGWSELKNDIFCLQQPSKNTQNNACTQTQSSTKSTQTSSEATVGSSKTTALTRSSKSSTSNPSLKSYAIAVTPPIIFKASAEESDHSVLSATTSQNIPQASPGYLPLLAASYSLLSIGSLVAKMIYS